MKSGVTEDGEPNHDTLAKLLRLRNNVDNIYDTFQSCWDGEIIMSKGNFLNTDLVNLDTIHYAVSKEVFNYSKPKHFNTEKYSISDIFSGD